MTSRLLVLLAVLWVASGCSSVPGSGDTGTGDSPSEGALALRKAVRVAEVMGDGSSNPAWKSNVSAEEFREQLEQALIDQGWAARSEGRFQLAVELLEVNEPALGGLTMKVDTIITYILTSAESGRLVSQETITAPFEAGVEDSLLGFERLRLAKEGSIRANIEMYIDLLIEEAERNPRFHERESPDVSASLQ